jgi:hypothetical protein
MPELHAQIAGAVVANLGLVLDHTAQREPYKHVESWRNSRRTVHIRTSKP